MSREALSLEISHLVSRVVRGEAIDIPEKGAALAAKYPDTGMSGVLIGQAIERAAGMVGMIRSAPEPVRQKPSLRVIKSSPPPAVEEKKTLPAEASAAPAPAASNGHPAAVTARPAPAPVKAVAAEPPPVAESPAMNPALIAVANSIDEDLAAAIDAEIGVLISGHRARPAAPEMPPAPAPSIALPSWTSEEAPAPEVIAQATSAANAKAREPEHASLFSSFRRALFRS